MKEACKNFSSCITNYLNGNTETFRIKYWEKTKKKKVIEIEKASIKGSLLNFLKEIKCTYNKEDYKINNESTIMIHCDVDLRKYTLLVCEKVFLEDKSENDDTTGIDVGIRTFLTCFNNNEIIEIGHDFRENIKKHLDKIDKINANNEVKNKSKAIRKQYTIIKNIVDEMHWKSIKFLTDRYGQIIIGKMNIKEIVNKRNKKITNETKRIGLLMRHGDFLKRLEYKCAIKQKNLVIVNEKYTSGTCSGCGFFKKDLGGAQLYNCNRRGLKIGRDIHSARDMNIVGIKEPSNEEIY